MADLLESTTDQDFPGAEFTEPDLAEVFFLREADLRDIDLEVFRTPLGIPAPAADETKAYSAQTNGPLPESVALPQGPPIVMDIIIEAPVKAPDLPSTPPRDAAGGVPGKPGPLELPITIEASESTSASVQLALT